MVSRTIIVDATNQILGRMASIIAKKLLMGYSVIVVNAEKAVISGKEKMVADSYRLLFNVRTLRNPYKSRIYRPRSPTALVKQAVKNMLPRDKPRGREAFKRLKVYIGVPEELQGKEAIRFPEADASRLKNRYVTVEYVAKQMGWKGGGSS